MCLVAERFLGITFPAGRRVSGAAPLIGIRRRPVDELVRRTMYGKPGLTIQVHRLEPPGRAGMLDERLRQGCFLTHESQHPGARLIRGPVCTYPRSLRTPPPVSGWYLGLPHRQALDRFRRARPRTRKPSTGVQKMCNLRFSVCHQATPSPLRPYAYYVRCRPS